MENRGFSFRSILKNSLWITLIGILLFSLSTMERHNFGCIKLFSVTGTLLMTLPWIIQLVVTSAVILLHKTFGYNLMWIVQSPKPEVNTPTNVVITSPPLSSRQVVKKGDVDKIKITTPLGMIMEIEGRNNTKLLTNGSLVAA